MDSLIDLSLTDVSRKIHARDWTPSELCESYLTRIASFDNTVHAFSLVDFDGARRDAEALTKEAARGQFRSLIHGIPFGIKDEFHVAGMPTGMRDLDVPRPEPVDATCVARIRAAGGIIVGKTHMPINGKLPPTRNPYNDALTAGGTSSGSGAAVSARMVPAAIGEQTMGSNLRPAAYCGVAAIKPTYGRISRFGCYPFAWSADTVGIIAIAMTDLAIVLSIIAGPDVNDPTALNVPPPKADLELTKIRPPRLGIIRNIFPERADPIMQTTIERTAGTFKEAGATISDVFLPKEFAHIWSAHKVISAAEGATFYADQQEDRELGGSGGRAGALIPATYYLQARRIRNWLRALTLEHCQGVDALVLPTAAGPAPLATSGTGDPWFLSPWTALGFPSINLPVTFTADHLPLGLQLVAKPHEDYQLLQFGAWCEQVVGRLEPPTIAIRN